MADDYRLSEIAEEFSQPLDYQANLRGIERALAALLPGATLHIEGRSLKVSLVLAGLRANHTLMPLERGGLWNSTYGKLPTNSEGEDPTEEDFYEGTVVWEERHLLAGWDPGLHNLELRWTVRSLLAELSEQDLRLATVLVLRFGFLDGEIWTLQRIGDLLGTTRERARQLIEIAQDRIAEIVLMYQLIDHIRTFGPVRYRPFLRSRPRAGITLVRRPSEKNLRSWLPMTEVAVQLGMQQRVLNTWLQQSSFPSRKIIDGSVYLHLGHVVDWAYDHDLIRYRVEGALFP